MIATPPPVEQQLIMVSAILFSPEEGMSPFGRVSANINAVTIRRAPKDHLGQVPPVTGSVTRHLPTATRQRTLP